MLVASGLGLLVLFFVGAILIQATGPSDHTVAMSVRGDSEPDIDSDRDEQLRRRAVGTWRDYYQGTRTLTLRPDGTALMVVELSGFKARLFTPRLELDIAWFIRDGKMHRRTVGGRPADKVEFVNQRAGVAVAEPVLELTGDRMVLVDQNGSQKYTWQRIR